MFIAWDELLNFRYFVKAKLQGVEITAGFFAAMSWQDKKLVYQKK